MTADITGLTVGTEYELRLDAYNPTALETFSPLPNPVDSATCAALIATELVPYALEKRTRKCFPPMVVWTNCRSVLFASGAGGKFPGSVNCGPQPHVVTQWPSAAAMLS